MKQVAAVFAVLIGILALSWILQGNDWFMYKFWAPKYEAVRRETYEQTKSYRQGSVQRLNTLCTQIDAADDDHKSMLRDVVAHEFAEWDSADVPAYLRACLEQARAH